MNRLSDRINALAPSATLAMSQKSNELRAQGVDVINLSVGEPDFFTPDHIKAAAKQAVDDNYSFYSPVPGYLSLRQAVCEKLRRENGLEYTPDQIVIGNGAKHELTNAIMALINPGDEVIIPTPAWVSYVQMVNLAGGKSVLLPSSMEKNFKVTADELEAVMTDKTRLIIICSPSNPSGAIYNREELKAIADMLARHPEVMVIADEIYEHINYVGRHESLAQFDAIKEQVVIINGVSKAYAMTGYRIGYIAAPLWVPRPSPRCRANTPAACPRLPRRLPRLPITARRTASRRCASPLSAAATSSWASCRKSPVSSSTCPTVLSTPSPRWTLTTASVAVTPSSTMTTTSPCTC